MRIRARLVGWMLAAGTVGVACGGNVVVDSATLSGISSGGASTASGAGADTGSTGASPGTAVSGSTGTGVIGVPDAGASSTTCAQEYYDMVMALESALGCTPTDNIVQCTGKFTLHDPCGCLHVINDTALPPNFDGTDSAWAGCVTDGCCGQPNNGCPACPAAPTVGHCDSFTSQCQNGG